jgi:tetratricopeptide (TPR) repeat protein
VKDGSAGDAPTSGVLHVLGAIERLEGRHGLALRLQQESLESIRGGPRADRERMPILAETGLDQLELGQADLAASSLEEALRLFGRLEARATPGRADALVGLGRARLGQGRPADALAPLEEADAFWQDFDAGNRWAGEAAFWLGRCYSALGRSAEGRQALARARAILSRSPVPMDSSLARLAREG